MRTDQSNKGNILHKLKSQKEIKKITDSKEYKDADYKGKTEMLGGKVLKKEKNKKKKKVLSIRDAAKQVVAEGGSPSLIQDEARMDRMDKLIGIIPSEKMAKGGRVGLKSGSKGCKLAMKGKGRAYGKNS
jgi:hypothetical protein